MALQQTLQALSDPIRRKILEILKKKSLSAGDISAHFSVSMPAISRHLAVLKEAGLIRDRREGKYIFYDLNTSVFEEILLWIQKFKGVKND